jgi:putative intracellular protease/amidase/YHS domain-containing protein
MRSALPIAATALAILLPFVLFAAVTVADDSMPEEMNDTRLALGGVDPVLLVAGKEVAGLENVTEKHAGFIYRFAGEKSQRRFRDDPESYAIQLDGHCGAMPSANGNPEIFAVHEEKIYIFGGSSCREEFLADPAGHLRTGEKRNVAIMVYPGVELLDFAGPGEVFAAAAAHGGAFEVYTVGLTTDSLLSQGFVRIVPEYSVKDAPRADIVVVPGGGVGSLMKDEAAMEWIRRSAEDATILSVCNGALALAELGLLDGLDATTHHGSIDSLRNWSKKIRVHDNARFVDNGRIITSAGVSAGIDAALHLVGRLIAPEAAEATAKYMEYDWRPELMKEHSVQRADAGR